MKICFVVSQLFAWGTYGGFGTMTRNIARGLVERGIEVHAIVPKRRGQNKKEILDGIKIHGINLLNPREIINTHKEIDADIYHSEEPYWGTFLAKIFQPNKKHIVTFIDPRTFYDWWIEISFYPFKKKLISPLYYFFERSLFISWSVRNANLLCKQTNFIESKARRIYSIPNDKEVMFLPNPIKNSIGDINKSSNPSVFFLARLDRRKRPELCFKLASKFPQITFNIIGKSHDISYEQYLKDKYKHFNNLFFHGLIDQYQSEKMFNILRESWILINTAAREGLPAAFLESMAYECAILSSNNPDNLTSQFGYFAENDDFEMGLAWLIEKNRWRELGKKGKEYFIQKYEWDHAINRHIEIYEKALQK